jgi:hypothetical protein
MSRPVALYPRPWRQRYETEFLEVLASRPLTSRDRLDVVLGALEARLRPDPVPPRRIREGSWRVAVAGFGLFVVAMVIAATGPIRYDDIGAYRDGVAALPFLAVAMFLLCYGLARTVLRLPAGDRLGQFAGMTAIACGLIWSVAPWLGAIGCTFLVAVLGLAVSARRAGLWPASAEIVLVTLLVVPAGVTAATLALPWYALRLTGIGFELLLLPIGGLWLVVSLVLFREFPEPAR